MTQTQQSTGQQTGQQSGQQSDQQNQSSQQYDQSSQYSGMPQSGFDTTFLAQVGQGDISSHSVDWQREYFDSVEWQIRSARRVAEYAALAEIQRTMIAKTAQLVRNQVVADLRRDPSFLQQLQQSSGSGR